MRFVFGKRRVLAAISLAFILTACGGSSHARSGTATVREVKATVLPHWYTTRFAGFFPPVGARATLPAHGKTLFEVTPNAMLYADGHIITDRGVQRLTPWGARLLWSKIRAIGLAAGLFRHNTVAKIENPPSRVDGTYLFCSGRRMLSTEVDGRPRRVHPRPDSPLALARVRAIARIETLFANATSRLPARAWADRMIRPYVPSHYDLGYDRAGPDPAKLPSPAREELAKYQPLPPSFQVTTAQARALIAAFVKSGVKPVRSWGELNFQLPITHVGAWGQHSTILRFDQDVPGSDTYDHIYCEY